MNKKQKNNTIIYQKNQQVLILTTIAIYHDAMWHVDVFCHYLVIVVDKNELSFFLSSSKDRICRSEGKVFKFAS